MPLAKQTVDVPLFPGQDDSADSILSNRPKLVNCRYVKTGAITKRFGMTAIGNYNKRLDGTYPAVCENLFTYGDELIRVGAGKLDSFKVINSTSDWILKDTVPECVVTNFSRTPDANDTDSYPTVAYCSGYVISAYTNLLATGPVYSIIVDVVDATTGIATQSRYVASTSAASLLNPVLTVSGTTVGLFWFNATTNLIRGRFFNITTQAWTAEATYASGVANRFFDISVYDSTHYVIAYEKTAAGGLEAFAFDTAGTQTWAPVGVAQTGIYSMSVDAVSGERVWIAFGYDNAGAKSTAAWTLTTTGTTEVTTTVLKSVVTANTIDRIGITRISSTRAKVACTYNNDSTYYAEAEIQAGPVIGVPGVNFKQLKNFRLLSNPFIANSRVYAVITNCHNTHATNYVVDITSDTALPTNVSAPLIAVFNPRQAPIQITTAPATWSTNYVDRVCRPAQGINGFDFFATVMLKSNTLFTQNVGLVRINFISEWNRTAREAANLLAITGGILTAYDGQQTFELGYAYEPDMASCVAFTTAGGGSLENGKSYTYKFVYCFTDAKGNVHRSAPSTARVYAPTGATATIGGTVPPLHLTNKFSDTIFGSDVKIEIYRSLANPGTNPPLYYVKSIQNVVNSANIAFTDGDSDTVISVNRTIYTNGDVLDNVTTPSATLVHYWKQALILAGTDDGNIWISKAIIAGEGPSFNDSLILEPLDSGPVTAMATLDHMLVFFTAKDIWVVDGEPPNDLGASSMPKPTRIQSVVGCVDPNSVVNTPDGVTFYSGDQIYLLSRNLDVQPIGKQIESSFVTPTSPATLCTRQFAGACIVPGIQTVRFIQFDSPTNSSLNYDYYKSALMQTPVWTVDNYSDPGVGSPQAYAQAAVMWRGKLTWISYYGYTYQESTTLYYDSAQPGTSSVNYWVTSSFTSAYEKSAGPQGLHRVYQTSLLGTYESACGASVSFTTDVGTEGPYTWTEAQMLSLKTSASDVSLQVHNKRQKVSFMKFSVVDVAPVTIGTGKGLTFRNVSLSVGIKQGLTKLSSARKQQP